MITGSNLTKEVSSFKYLGVHVDTQLEYNVQTKQMKNKFSQLCGKSFRLSNLVNYVAARNIYNPCIYSATSYCIVVWGGG